MSNSQPMNSSLDFSGEVMSVEQVSPVIPEFIISGFDDSGKNKKNGRTRLLSHKYIKKLLRLGYIFEANPDN